MSCQTETVNDIDVDTELAIIIPHRSHYKAIFDDAILYGCPLKDLSRENLEVAIGFLMENPELLVRSKKIRDAMKEDDHEC